jgi:septal ring factor EnvC (AmiA/AmiB activator)
MRVPRFSGLAVVALLLLGGCATMAGWVGIASEAQLEEQAATTEARLAQADTEIAQLKDELEAYNEKAGRLERLTEDLEKAIRSTQELQELAQVMEARLQEVPQDTLRLFVKIIVQYLEDHPSGS